MVATKLLANGTSLPQWLIASYQVGDRVDIDDTVEVMAAVLQTFIAVLSAVVAVVYVVMCVGYCSVCCGVCCDGVEGVGHADSW